MEKIQDRSSDEDAAFVDSIEPALVGVSDERYDELRATWLEEADAVDAKQAEVLQALTDLEHAYERADGIAVEIGIALAIPSPEGMTGDTLINDLGPELMEVLSKIEMLPSQISVAISEFDGAVIRRDAAAREFFGQLKLRN